MSGCLIVFLVCTGFGVLVNIFDSPKRHETDKPEMSETEKRQKLRESLDPPSKTPLTSKQHLETAKRLLAQIDVNDYDKADVLIFSVSEHAERAREDPHSKAQADLVMKRMANKALEVVKMKAWNAPGAAINAEVTCKLYISSRLKAPSTADWSDAVTARWRDHPGYFLVTHTVDAQNSFGAKLRTNYQCEVVCLSKDLCEVQKMYQIER